MNEVYFTCRICKNDFKSEAVFYNNFSLAKQQILLLVNILYKGNHALPDINYNRKCKCNISKYDKSNQNLFNRMKYNFSSQKKNLFQNNDKNLINNQNKIFNYSIYNSDSKNKINNITNQEVNEKNKKFYNFSFFSYFLPVFILKKNKNYYLLIQTNNYFETFMSLENIIPVIERFPHLLKYCIMKTDFSYNNAIFKYDYY